jgi:TonB family protein
VTAASFFRDITAFSVQIALVALAIAVLVKLVRVPARVRYVSLRLALAATLLVPWLLRAPEVQGPTSAAVNPKAASFLALPPAGTQSSAAVSGAVPVAPVETPPAIPWTRIVLGALFTGVVARAMWLAVGVLRLLRLKRRGLVVDVPEYSELQRQLGTRATIAHVAGLAQPATFGIRRPIVLLPDAMASAPASLRRAVVTHELFHVRRGDWLSVLGEEAIRTVLWFHPAILWLTSHIQLAREEMVDELTVQATGDRRAYMQALLAFADTGGLGAAPAFAHRRQLFHRILSVSKEKVMSAPRIVTSIVVLIAAVSGASFYASSVFPIVTEAHAAVPTLTTTSKLAVRSQGTDKIALTDDAAGDETAAGQRPHALLLNQQSREISARPVTPDNPIPRRTRGEAPLWPSEFAASRFEVAVSTLVTLDQRGVVTAVDRNECAVSGSAQSGEGLCRAFFEASADAIRQWRYERPERGPIRFNVIVTFRPGAEPAVTQSGTPLAVRGSRLSAGPTMLPDLGVVSGSNDDVLRIRLAEISAAFRELERTQRLLSATNPELVKIHERMAQLNDDLTRVEEQLRRQALERQQLTTTVTVSPTPGAISDRWPFVSLSGRAPLNTIATRIPGLQMPVVTKSPKPQHSAEAMRARVEGTVRLEALVDERGLVADVRVVKSIPLLDQSALEAARQWEFKPALLNGEPVPVLVVLELEFNLRK